MTIGQVELPLEKIRAICDKYRISRLSVFGSALRDDFGPKSDIDLLVEFKPNHGIGLIEYVQCQEELADVLGRRVDLVQKSGLKPAVRGTILHAARVVYAN